MTTVPVPPGVPPPGVPQAVVAHPHPEPRSYPLMLRTWTYQAWRPIGGIALLVIGLMLVVPFALLPVLAVGVALQGGPFLAGFQAASTLAKVTPASMLYLNLSLAAAIPLTWLIVRYLHRMRPRWLTSVRPGMRWKFFCACLGLAAVALLAQIALGALIPSGSAATTRHPVHLNGTLVALVLVIVLTTPLQAIGEEYAFRGYLTQAVGALTKSSWAAVLVSSVVFALAHGVQNFPLFFDRFAFGLMAGYVVVRTGGLEAGIAMHIMNNLLAFGAAIATGDLEGVLKVSHVSWWNLPLTLTQNGVYLVLVLLLARQMGLRALTDPPLSTVAEPVPGGVYPRPRSARSDHPWGMG